MYMFAYKGTVTQITAYLLTAHAGINKDSIMLNAAQGKASNSKQNKAGYTTLSRNKLSD